MDNGQEAQGGGLPTQEASLARVLDVRGSWACLLFPETGETGWVDLAELGFEVVPVTPSPRIAGS